MTFVPWEKYNICKLYALPRASCKARVCKYDHPPQEVVWRIWNLHDESKPSRDHLEGDVQDGQDAVFGGDRRDFERARGERPRVNNFAPPESATQYHGHHEDLVGESYHSRPARSGTMDGVHPDRVHRLPPQAYFPSSPATAERPAFERRAEHRSPRLGLAGDKPTWREREAANALASNSLSRYGPPSRHGRSPASTSAQLANRSEHWQPMSRDIDHVRELSGSPERRPTTERQAPRRSFKGAIASRDTDTYRPAWTHRDEFDLDSTRAYHLPLAGDTPTWREHEKMQSSHRGARPFENNAPETRRPPPEQHFNPDLSSNDFINGTAIYRFVWGDPLCVRCGGMGHLPKGGFCKNEPLSKPEQEHLYKLRRAEQERSKRDDPKPLPRQMYLEPPRRYLSSEPRSFWQRSPSHPDKPNDLSKSQTKTEESSRSSYWQRYRQQKENSMSQRDEFDMIQIQPGARAPRGHKRDFDDFRDCMDGTRDKRPDDEVKIRGMSQVKKEVNAKVEVAVEVDPLTALAPVASTSNFVHPSRLALVDSARPTPPPPLLKAYVPLTTVAPPTMGATKRMSNGEAKIVGPHPSTIRVSASYMTQAAIDKRLAPEGLDAQERSLAEAREDSVRLQGVAWLDNVRRHLQLPVKTFTTAVVYYHKFRLAHPKEDYQWIDAAAASLLTSCKNEDTLKKSRDILAAAYNMKLPSNQEQAATDDPMFETQSRMVIGIERLILESGGFDFRSRTPHHTLVKIGKSLPKSPDVKEISQLAWTVLTDLHRTFAPLKQTSSTLALASLELAAHFTAAKSEDNTCIVRENLRELNLSKWHTTREEVMETLLDGLDLYTHNTGSSILGSKYSLDDLLRIRLALNKECSDSSLPRYTVIQPPPSPDNVNDTSNTLRVANGHPTPVSPPQPGAQAPQPVNAYTATSQHTPQTDGTLRFMLNPQRATEERADVNRFYAEEWEEYEEEIEVPLPRDRSRERDRERDRTREGPLRREYPHDRHRESGRPRDFGPVRNVDDRSNVDRRITNDGPRAAAPARDTKVARQPNPSNMLQSVVRAPSPAPEIITQRDDETDRDRDTDRVRDRPRSRDRESRHDGRRHDDRDRYESRRDHRGRDDRDRNGGGGSSRRHYDEDRRRERR